MTSTDSPIALSHAVGSTDTPLIEQTIGDNLASAVGTYGDREALVVRHQGIRWTYNELWAEVTKVMSIPCWNSTLSRQQSA